LQIIIKNDKVTTLLLKRIIMENSKLFNELYSKYNRTPFFELDGVSKSLCDTIKKGLYELSEEKQKWETIPFNLMWFPMYDDYMYGQFFTSINHSLLMTVWWWSLEKLRDYITRLEDPEITMSFAEKISYDIADISNYDFWPKIKKNFSEIIKYSILPIFMTCLRKRIREMEDEERKTEWKIKKISRAVSEVLWKQDKPRKKS